MTHGIVVRPMTDADRDAVLDVHREAFGSDDEADLTAALLDAPDARPLESYVAEADGELVAHVLLTAAQVVSAPDLPARILAPLAVRPERQHQGLGTAVTVAALDAARAHGVLIVLVLGHPDYYPRFGFRPMLPLGPTPPHPISDDQAWQVLELRPGAVAVPGGRIQLARPLMAPEAWAPPT